LGDKLKITFEIDEQKEHQQLMALQASRMRSSIDAASEMIVDMMNYGPNVWPKTEDELANILNVLNDFLLEDK
jgi:hypothetical protein